MNFIKKYPFETVIILIIFYSIFFTSSWSGEWLRNKLTSLLVTLEILGIVLIIRFAWPEYFSSLKENLVSYIFSPRFKNIPSWGKVILTTPMGVSLMIIVTFIEFFSYLIIFRQSFIVIGFPYPIYSFSVGKIIFLGIFFNVILYSALLYLIAEVLKRQEMNR